MFIWGIREKEHRPEIFVVDRDDVPVSVIIDETGPDGENVVVNIISTAFEMTDENAARVQRFYGIRQYHHIVGENIRKVVLW